MLLFARFAKALGFPSFQLKLFEKEYPHTVLLTGSNFIITSGCYWATLLWKYGFLSSWASIGCLHNCFKYHFFLAIWFGFKVMAVSESMRLFASLKKEHVPVQRLVVNQVLPPSTSECKFCEMKRKVPSQTSLFFNCNEEQKLSRAWVRTYLSFLYMVTRIWIAWIPWLSSCITRFWLMLLLTSLDSD